MTHLSKLTCLCVVSSLAFSAGAETQTGVVGLPSRNIEAKLTGDFNGDGLPDFAMLIGGKDKDNGAKISRFQILLAQPGDGAPRYRRILDEEVGYEDRLVSTIRLNPKGSIILNTRYAASGAGDNETWTRILTMLVRNGEALGIGYAYSDGERISGRVNESCDINLLTGQGIRNGKAIRVTATPIAVRRILDTNETVTVPGCAD